MKTVIANLKIELKTLAKTIKESRAKFRKAQSALSLGGTDWKEKNTAEDDMLTAKYEFRHKHIVYCVLRGRTRDQIEKPGKKAKCEKTCFCCNKPNEKHIETLLAEYQSKMEPAHEATCVSAG